MALQDIRDPAVEPLEHAVGLRPHRWSEAMLVAEVRAEQVELVLPAGAAPVQAEQAVGEGPAIVRPDVIRSTARDEEAGQDVDDVRRSQPPVGPECQALRLCSSMRLSMRNFLPSWVRLSTKS
jgi:hypothetical protein